MIARTVGATEAQPGHIFTICHKSVHEVERREKEAAVLPLGPIFLRSQARNTRSLIECTLSRVLQPIFEVNALLDGVPIHVISYCESFCLAKLHLRPVSLKSLLFQLPSLRAMPLTDILSLGCCRLRRLSIMRPSSRTSHL